MEIKLWLPNYLNFDSNSIQWSRNVDHLQVGHLLHPLQWPSLCIKTWQSLEEVPEKVKIAKLAGGNHEYLTWMAIAEKTSLENATLMLTCLGNTSLALVVRQRPKPGSPVTISEQMTSSSSSLLPNFQDASLMQMSAFSLSSALHQPKPENKKQRGKTMLPCLVCGKSFDRPSLLKRHLRTHTGEKPHICQTCNKGFSTSSSLNTHKRIHSGEKPHQCTICGKRFTASSNLYYHKMTHSKDARWRQNRKMCKKVFQEGQETSDHLPSSAHDFKPLTSFPASKPEYPGLSRKPPVITDFNVSTLLQNGVKCGLCSLNFMSANLLHLHLLSGLCQQLSFKGISK